MTQWISVRDAVVVRRLRHTVYGFPIHLRSDFEPYDILGNFLRCVDGRPGSPKCIDDTGAHLSIGQSGTDGIDAYLTPSQPNTGAR